MTSYYQDASVSAYDSIVSPLIEKFEGAWKYSNATSYVGAYTEFGVEELVEELLSGDSELDVLVMNTLARHAGACFINAYLKENPVPRRAVKGVDAYRYAGVRVSGVFEEFQKRYPSSLYFGGTLPGTLIGFDRFSAQDVDHLEWYVEYVDTLSGLYGSVCGDAPDLFIEDKFSNIKNLLSSKHRMPELLFEEWLNVSKDGMKLVTKNKLNKKIGRLLGEAVEVVFSHAGENAESGRDGYAFIASHVIWENSGMPEMSKMAVELLSRVDDDLAPKFIKDTEKQFLPHHHERMIPS